MEGDKRVNNFEFSRGCKALKILMYKYLHII